jgi:hypothetical protein
MSDLIYLLEDSYNFEIAILGISGDMVYQQLIRKLNPSCRDFYKRIKIQMLTAFVENRGWERRAFLVYGMLRARQRGITMAAPSVVDLDKTFESFVDANTDRFDLVTRLVTEFPGGWQAGRIVAPADCVVNGETLV